MIEIKKGDVVKYVTGYYRVSAKFKATCNLAGVFSSYIHHRKVPLTEVVEAHDEWYAHWQQSDTYKCMWLWENDMFKNSSDGFCP